VSKARQTRARRKIWERRRKLAERRKARLAAEMLRQPVNLINFRPLIDALPRALAALQVSLEDLGR
jgi:hypothetical protein